MLPIYGIIPSWGLGKSLGIDLISRRKVCSFDCIYCQLGKTTEKTKERRIFVRTEKIKEEFEKIIDKVSKDIDVITFSGTGEPTLALNISDTVKIIREHTDIPIAILTNSSLLYLKNVRRELCSFDIVVAKLDAPDNYLLNKINRPVEGITFDKIFKSLKKFRKEFDGKFALQIMFLDENKKLFR